MHRFFWSLSAFFVLLIVLAACKSQKPASRTPKPTTNPDSLALAQKDTFDRHLPLPDTTVLIAKDSINLPLVPPKKDTIIITGVGDIMLGTNFPETYYLPPNEGKDMLTNVAPIFTGSDIVFGNLEGVLLDSGGVQKKCRNPKNCYLFRSPEYMGKRLQEAGFNLLSVANNHAGDFGNEGRVNTGRVLDSLNIHFAGSDEHPFKLFEQDDIKYGFAAFSPNKGTPSINNLVLAREIIAHLDSLADIVIVSFHGGAEGKDFTGVLREHEYFYGEDRGDVYEFAHAMIDAGADIIIGHGPHVPRAIEIYQQRFIAYSLGNFATYARFNLTGVNGLAPVIQIAVDKEGKYLSGQIISCRQYGWGIPKIDPENAAGKLIYELTKKDLPEVKITIDESGFISYLHQ
jgi:Bacterial capsule synthesis protein PGA_cap